MNVDSFESYSDSDLWSALESAHLRTCCLWLGKEITTPHCRGWRESKVHTHDESRLESK